MNNQYSVNTTTTPNTAHWLAIFSLFIGVTSLIAAEFIPISLLTTIATDFTITEGKAGQSITMVGIFAVLTSLLLAPLTSKINRRTILLILSLLLVFSNVIVAIAPNYNVMLIGRMLLGICVGGFWSMTSAVVLQLVPTHYVPRALSIVYAGVSLATIISLPIASYLGLMIGWRNVFWLSAGLSLVALLCQVSSLPSLPVNSANNFGDMFTLLKQRWILFGIISIIFSYGGYHIVFTYLQPFLEQNLVLPAKTLTSMLLLFGIFNCLGTVVAGFLLDRFFNVMMISLHIILTIIAILLFINNHNTYVALILVMLWGWLFGFIPVGWSTWITRTLADKADIAGGLSVAAIQFSIGLAAGIGGWTFDHLGINSIFITAAVIFIVGIITIMLCFAGYRRITGHKV